MGDAPYFTFELDDLFPVPVVATTTRPAGISEVDANGRLLPKKVCQYCACEQLALRFPKDSESPDGYGEICTECLSGFRAEKAQQDAMDVAYEVDEESIESLRDAIRDGNPGIPDDCTPHISSTYEEIMRALGGNRSFARLIATNVLATKPGSKDRTKALQDLMKLGIKVTEEGRAKKLEDIPNEELNQRLVHMLEEIRARKPITSEAKFRESRDSRELVPA